MQTSSGNKVELHCKSKEDDLGLHTLAPTEQFEWGFRTAIFETTLFFCGASWSLGHKEFDSFKDDPNFEDDCGGRHCFWKAQEDGLYLYNNKDNNIGPCCPTK
ncbi:hypothetical protein V2J09_007260 [Rumex salicifolius]